MAPPENNTDTSPRWSGLKTRAIYGGALAIGALLILWLGGWLFALLVIAAGLQALREWDGLTANSGIGWKLGGMAYVGIPCASLIWLRNVRFETDTSAGGWLVLYVLLAVWATDIGAYFAGRAIGGPKLAPAISPNKTWAGLAGGIVAAALAGGVAAIFTPYPLLWMSCLSLGAVLAIVSQAGDLFESWLKRRAGVKDSGRLIPGHGGLLDRIDGLMFAVPLVAWLVFISGYGV